MKSRQTIVTELNRLRREDEDLNVKIYPAESLHALGVRSPLCSLCCAIRALEYVLENYMHSANLTKSELKKTRVYLAGLEEMYETELPAEALINNLEKL